MVVGWNPVAVTIDKPYLKITANGDLIRNNMITLINKQSYFSYAVYPFLIAWHTCEELVSKSIYFTNVTDDAFKIRAFAYSV